MKSLLVPFILQAGGGGLSGYGLGTGNILEIILGVIVALSGLIVVEWKNPKPPGPPTITTPLK